MKVSQIKLNIVFLIIALMFLSHSNSLSQVLINEVSAMNYAMPFDDNFDSPDWIELYNSGDAPVNLDGYRISDRDDFDIAWELPAILLQPKEHILIFADGNDESKERRLTLEASGHGVSVLWDYDGFRYEYIEHQGDFDIQMRVHSFINAHNYGAVGLSLLKELTDRSSMVGMFCRGKGIAHFSSYIREVPNTVLTEHKTIIKPEYPYCRIQVKRVGDTVYTNVIDDHAFTLESKAHYFPLEDVFYIGIAVSSADRSKNCRAVLSEIKFNGEELTGSDFQSVEWHLPMESKKYYSNELHADFKLNKDSESLYIFESDGSLADQITYNDLRANVTYGRYTDGSSHFNFIDEPTPGTENKIGKEFICIEPDFSIKGGFFNTTQELIITALESGSKVYYSIDGSMPTEESLLYTSPLLIDKTTVIRAKSVNEFGITSADATYTFFIDHDGTLPVFSLSSDPYLLFSEEEGLLHDNNIWPSKQIPLSIELWEHDELVYSAISDAKLHGRWSRNYPQRSIRLYARKKYDTPDFNFNFFGDRSQKNYEHIILRNGGNDWDESRIRDAYCNVISHTFENLIYTEHKPIVTYINGEYWGLFNLRERLNEEYLSEKFDVTFESVNLIEQGSDILSGSNRTYVAIFDSVNVLDMKKDESINILSELIDLNNIIDYSVLNIFLGNFDWPFNNIRCFSSEDLDGKWRWINYDMDFSLGYQGTGIYNNTFDRALNPDTSDYSKLMVNLLDNNKFKHDFINRFADLMNTKLRYENTIQIFDSLINEVEHEIARHRARWPKSMLDYESNNNEIRDFLRDKAEAERQYIIEQFDLSGEYKLTLKTNVTNAAAFEINTVNITTLPWSGYYFSGVPIRIKVIPKLGKKFLAWSDSKYGESVEITVDSDENIELTAYFENSTSGEKTIVINEFMYNAPDEADSKDWVELLNYGDEIVDLGSWILSDDNDEHQYIIPTGTILAPEELIVICKDSENFSGIHANIQNIIGDLDFGFGSSDAIRLFDDSDELIDFVDYTSEFPWYPEANGTGLSLELIAPEYDNALPTSWRLTEIDNGTPGEKNSVGDTNIIPPNIAYTFYPQPADDYIKLEMLDPDKISNLILADAKGRIMADYLDHIGTITKMRDGYNIQLFEFASGVYYLMLIDGETKKDVIPLIIQR